MEEKEIDYINVIPFVDIMLVLLTIVLTTSSFIATGAIPVNLPKASQNRQETLKVRTIDIDGKGRVYFEGLPLSLQRLRETLLPLDRNIPFLIRADRDIALQSFVDILDVVKNLGFQKVSLQTESNAR
jgi:biopolymer transport protein ExbD